MIVSDLKNSSRIELLHPLFKQLFDYVKQHNLLKTELGRITLDGDNLFINNVDLDGVKKEKQVLELHRKYIDVHIPLSGKETIGWKPLEKLENELLLMNEIRIALFIRICRLPMWIFIRVSLSLFILKILMLPLLQRGKYVS